MTKRIMVGKNTKTFGSYDVDDPVDGRSGVFRRVCVDIRDESPEAWPLHTLIDGVGRV